MSTTTPPSSTTTTTTPGVVKTETPRWMHYGAWGVAVLGPVVLFMPPRRVGFQALTLATGTFAATNLLVYDYTGTTLLGRWRQRFRTVAGATEDNNNNSSSSSSSGSSSSFLPEKAQRTQELLRLERERREAALPEAERRALREAREKKEADSRGLLASLWMGDAKGDWREERKRKEKEALAEGKGYGDLIIEQVKEVFGGSSTKQNNGADGAEGAENKNNNNTDDKK